MPHTGELIVADGVNSGDPRFGRLSEAITTDAHGRYEEAVYRGRVFLACSQAGTAAAAGLSATIATISLTNPPGSGRVLSLLGALIAVTAAPAAAAALGIAAFIPGLTTAIVHTTPLTVRAALLGGPSIGAVGLADAVATLPAAPVFVLPLLGWATGVGQGQPWIDLVGMLSLWPGSVATIQATAAVTALWGFLWEELPL